MNDLPGWLRKLAAARRAVFAALGLFLLFGVAGWFIAPRIVEDCVSLLGGQEAYQVFVGEYFAARLLVAAVFALALLAHAALLPAARRLRKRVAPYCAAIPLFWAGVAFSRLVLAPFTIAFLLRLGEEVFAAHIALYPFIGMCLFLYVAMGVVFLMPVAVSLLHSLGIARAAALRRARWRFLLGAVIVMAVITPTQDAVTLLVATAPVLLLYEASILVVALAERRRG